MKDVLNQVKDLLFVRRVCLRFIHKAKLAAMASWSTYRGRQAAEDILASLLYEKKKDNHVLTGPSSTLNQFVICPANTIL